MLPHDPSPLLVAGFVALPVAMALLFLFAARRVAGNVPGLAFLLAIWMGGTGALAAAGLLAHFDPPRPLPVLVVTVIGLVLLLRSPLGRRLASLPLVLLVGFQAFRIGVELLIHRAVDEGIAPPEMSWDGYNLDILTGVTALLVAPVATRLPRAALHAWNVVGLGLLLTVVGTGVLAMPSPLQQIHTTPPNVWIAHFPFIWLPTVLVAAALLGHGLLFIALRSAARPPGHGDRHQPALTDQ